MFQIGGPSFVLVSVQWAKESSEDDGVSVDMVFSQYDQSGSGTIDPLEVRGGPTLVAKIAPARGRYVQQFSIGFLRNAILAQCANFPQK